MPELQFSASSYQARSTQLLAQQCINAFVEHTPKEGKTQVPIYGTPGLSLFSRLGSGPINGLWVMGSLLYCLSGDALFSVTPLGVATLIGRTSLGGVVSMADNGLQLVMCDGYGGWIYQPGGINQVTTANALAGATVIELNITGQITAGDTLTIPLDSGANFVTTAADTVSTADGAITLATGLPSQVSAGATIIDSTVVLARIEAPAFMPSASVTYFDGYFIFAARGTRQFFLSGINDGSQYSGLDFATATSTTGFVVAVVNFHEQLLVFTSKQATEVWYDSGAAAFPFQRYDGVYIARGIAGPLCQCSEDNTVLWMGDDGVFYRNDGFIPKRLSTFAMEHAWAQYPAKTSDMHCFVLDQEGHKFAVLQFPSGNQTWVFDISTSLWHQRESWGSAWV